MYTDFVRIRGTKGFAQKELLSRKLKTEMEALLHSLRDWEVQWRHDDKPESEVRVLPQYQQRKVGFTTMLVFMT